MLASLRSRLTYANVVSTVALFVALGGVSYAVLVPANSVGTRQLKARSVTGSKIATGAIRSRQVRAGSLLGKDFARSQLPKGPKGDPGAAGRDGQAFAFAHVSSTGNPDPTLSRNVLGVQVVGTAIYCFHLTAPAKNAVATVAYGGAFNAIANADVPPNTGGSCSAPFTDASVTISVGGAQSKQAFLATFEK